MLRPTFCYCATAALTIVLLSRSVLPAQQKRNGQAEVYPVAILPFQERGRDAAELGGKVNDLLFAQLIVKPGMYLVEREDIKKLFDEQELNLSGLVNPGQATQVGYLTGAKIIVTGSVIVVDDSLYLVAKVIGTETSRVLGASSKGKIDDDLDDLVEELAESVAMTITARAADLVVSPAKRDDRLAIISKSLGKGKRPSIWIDIPERHVGQTTLDPAAATELTWYCKELGFEVIDAQEGGRNDADVQLLGEGFSQFAARHGNLISAKARLELKAVDRETGKVLAIDRQVAVSVDLAEEVAGKAALQEAAASIAERLLPKIVKPGKKK